MAVAEKDKILRKVTYHLYKNKMHEQTSVRGIYKHNSVTGELGVDPFKSCKTYREIREVFLTKEKKELESLFNEGADFILVKINKRDLTTFQQILPQDLINSVKFIRGDDV